MMIDCSNSIPYTISCANQ